MSGGLLSVAFPTDTLIGFIYNKEDIPRQHLCRSLLHSEQLKEDSPFALVIKRRESGRNLSENIHWDILRISLHFNELWIFFWVPLRWEDDAANWCQVKNTKHSAPLSNFHSGSWQCSWKCHPWARAWLGVRWEAELVQRWDGSCGLCGLRRHHVCGVCRCVMMSVRTSMCEGNG